MINELDTSIAVISEDDLSKLFDETPDKTPSADNLLGGKKPNDDTSNKDNKQNDKGQPDDNQQVEEGIVSFEEGGLPEDETDEEKAAREKAETEKKAKEEEEKKKKEAEAKAKGKDGKEGKDDKKSEGDAKAKPEVSSVLKNTVDYLIEQGIWKDFDGREDLEITEEVYADLVAKQDQERLKDQFEELVDRTGPYGKAIISYATKGGNPDDVIDLFKEQKNVESIDIKSEEGRKELVQKYYEDVVGWKADKAKNYVNSLIASNKLESEADEVKELFDNYYQQQLEDLNEQQETYIKEQQKREQAFEKNINDALTTRKDITDKDKRVIKDAILRYDKKLPDGNLVNDFYLKFAEMQSDPSKYIDLVMFVMDNDNYKKRIQKQSDSQAASKAFSFIKGNSALSNKKGSAHERVERGAAEDVEFNWNIPKK